MSIFYAKDSVEFELAKALGIGVAFEAEGDNINQPVNSNKAQSQNQTKSNFNSNLSSNNSINSAVNEVENINLTGDPEKDYQIIVDVLTKKTNYGQFIGELK